MAASLVSASPAFNLIAFAYSLNASFHFAASFLFGLCKVGIVSVGDFAAIRFGSSAGTLISLLKRAKPSQRGGGCIQQMTELHSRRVHWRQQYQLQ